MADIGGSVEGYVAAFNNSEANIGGSVNSFVDASDNGKINIKDSVNSLVRIDSSTISVGKDVGKIIYEGNSNVYVGGNSGAIIFRDAYNNDKGKITVEGTTKGIQIVIEKTTAITDSQNLVPTIILGTLEPGKNGKYVSAAAFDNESDIDNIEETILNNISYIIKTESDEKYSLIVDGATEIDGLLTAKENDQVMIMVQPNKGYAVSSVSGGQAALTKLSNGKYSLTVLRGGNITISAIAQVIRQINDESDSLDSGYIAIGTNGWMSNGYEWKMKKSDGQYVISDWYEVEYNGEKSWFYFDANGQMAKGWCQINGVWYYFNEETGVWTADTVNEQ
jgi:hypothetical protein